MNPEQMPQRHGLPKINGETEMVPLGPRSVFLVTPEVRGMLGRRRSWWRRLLGWLTSWFRWKN